MTISGKKHKNIRITGRVQGVGFRYAVRSVASSLGITGFARNLPNGDVYIEAEGDDMQLADFMTWCHQGPPRAVVKIVDSYDGPLVGFTDFMVKY